MIKHMNINCLEALITVADCSSFSIAAEQLHLTQPAVSKRIATLEQSLNTTLFDRIGRKIHLTEAGSKLLPVARGICGDMARVRHTIANLGESVSGRLSIGTSHHIGLHRLPTLLRQFKSTYPQVELDLHFLDSEDACTKVETSALELAVVTLPEKPFSKLHTELIWNDPLLLVSDIDHPLQKILKPEITHLSLYPAIVPSLETVTRQVLDKALLPYSVRLNIAMETNYIETIKMMVSVGLGWGAIPKTMITDDLIPIPIKALKLERKLGIAQLKGRSLSSAAQAFIELLRTHKSD